MAETVLWTIRLNNVAVGTRQIPEMQIPAGAIALVGALSRPDLNAAVVLTVRLDLSYDDRQTWRSWGAFTTTGGTMLNKDGTVSTESWIRTALPHPSTSQTWVRGTLVNTVQRLTADATVRMVTP